MVYFMSQNNISMAIFADHCEQSFFFTEKKVSMLPLHGLSFSNQARGSKLEFNPFSI